MRLRVSTVLVGHVDPISCGRTRRSASSSRRPPRARFMIRSSSTFSTPHRFRASGRADRRGRWRQFHARIYGLDRGLAWPRARTCGTRTRSISPRVRMTHSIPTTFRSSKSASSTPCGARAALGHIDYYEPVEILATTRPDSNFLRLRAGTVAACPPARILRGPGEPFQATRRRLSEAMLRSAPIPEAYPFLADRRGHRTRSSGIRASI